MSSDGLQSMRANDAGSESGAEGQAPTTGAPRLMRTVTLTTAGIMAWGVDAFAAFARTSMERGQQMEAGVQKLVERYHENAKLQGRAAAASRSDLAKQAAITLDENMKALWRVFMVTGTQEQAGEPPADRIQPAMQGEQHDGDSSTA